VFCFYSGVWVVVESPLVVSIRTRGRASLTHEWMRA
jgi:hypothetical protein